MIVQGAHCLIGICLIGTLPYRHLTLSLVVAAVSTPTWDATVFKILGLQKLAQVLLLQRPEKQCPVWECCETLLHLVRPS